MTLSGVGFRSPRRSQPSLSSTRPGSRSAWAGTSSPLPVVPEPARRRQHPDEDRHVHRQRQRPADRRRSYWHDAGFYYGQVVRIGINALRTVALGQRPRPDALRARAARRLLTADPEAFAPSPLVVLGAQRQTASGTAAIRPRRSSAAWAPSPSRNQLATAPDLRRPGCALRSASTAITCSTRVRVCECHRPPRSGVRPDDVRRRRR